MTEPLIDGVKKRSKSLSLISFFVVSFFNYLIDLRLGLYREKSLTNHGKGGEEGIHQKVTQDPLKTLSLGVDKKGHKDSDVRISVHQI